jgi:hypothetical protein
MTPAEGIAGSLLAAYNCHGSSSTTVHRSRAFVGWVRAIAGKTVVMRHALALALCFAMFFPAAVPVPRPFLKEEDLMNHGAADVAPRGIDVPAEQRPRSQNAP